MTSGNNYEGYFPIICVYSPTNLLLLLSLVNLISICVMNAMRQKEKRYEGRTESHEQQFFVK